jgi:hypothetical protein
LINVIGLFPYEEAKEKQFIDQGILPLCESIYRLGGTPIASCEGHEYTRSWIDNFFWYKKIIILPYVMFAANMEDAKKIHDALTALQKEKKNKLNFRALANFGIDGNLYWTLRTDNIRLDSGLLTKAMVNGFILETAINLA